MNSYEITVGLEVHVELNTSTKMFCSCPVKFGASPNTEICPVCTGLPGALPRINKKAVEFAIKAGLATNCEISRVSRMARKNYFYPDLPKAFQISQLEPALCRNGHVTLDTDNGKKDIRITRIHIEEDAGKLIHDRGGETLIDYNRCGTPLIEIVSAPDIHSGDEAKLYLKKLRTLLLYTGISDCKMNEGSMRCDVNISVKSKDSDTLGQRVEIKNLNSFAFVAKAIDAEFLRMVSVLEKGGKIERETRRYNEATGKTESMRSKEDVADYRFFTEPDILPIYVSDEDINRIGGELPSMPDERKARYEEILLLSEYDSSLLCSDKMLSDFFDSAEKRTEYKKDLANLLLGETLRLCEGEDFECPFSADSLAELATLLGEKKISSTTAKKLLVRMWKDGISPMQTVENENLYQINDVHLLTELAKEAINANTGSADDYRAGKKNALKAIVGYVMSKSKGLANPVITESILKGLLEK